jgi:hypothetical protein
MKPANSAIKVLLILTVGLALLYPPLEIVDTWDAPANVSRTGSDTELEILGVLLALGLVVVLARLVVAVCKSIGGSLPITVRPSRPDRLQPADTLVLFPRLVPLRI